MGALLNCVCWISAVTLQSTFVFFNTGILAVKITNSFTPLFLTSFSKSSNICFFSFCSALSLNKFFIVVNNFLLPVFPSDSPEVSFEELAFEESSFGELLFEEMPF